MNRDKHELRDHVYFKDLSDEEWSEIKEHAYKIKQSIDNVDLANAVTTEVMLKTNEKLVSLVEDMDILIDDFIDMRDFMNKTIIEIREMFPKVNES